MNFLGSSAKEQTHLRVDLFCNAKVTKQSIQQADCLDFWDCCVGKGINKMLTEKRLYIVFYCLFTLSRGKGDKVIY